MRMILLMVRECSTMAFIGTGILGFISDNHGRNSVLFGVDMLETDI